jgi:hypothetical protein
MLIIYISMLIIYISMLIIVIGNGKSSIFSRNGANIAHEVSKFWLFQEVKFADVVSLKTFFKNPMIKYVKYATLLKYVIDVVYERTMCSGKFDGFKMPPH